jgi:hypothetical protein
VKLTFGLLWALTKLGIGLGWTAGIAFCAAVWAVACVATLVFLVYFAMAVCCRLWERTHSTHDAR